MVDLETGSLFGGAICDGCRGDVELLLAIVPGSEGIYIRLVRRTRRLAATGSFANARSRKELGFGDDVEGVVELGGYVLVGEGVWWGLLEGPAGRTPRNMTR